jgi:hypothetical protein
MSPGTLLRNLRPADGTGEADRDSNGVPVRHSRYGLLLLVLLFSYVLSAFTRGTWVLALQIGLFLVVSALAVQSERLKRRTAQVLVGVTIGGSAVAIALALAGSRAGAGVGYLWAALMLLFAVVLIVRRVLAQPDVSLQSIFGAVSAYVIIGLMFAAIYGAINQFTDLSFFAHGATGNLKTFQYFSFTTLTTLGYGDYTAAQPGGQSVAVMEAMLGQIFLATLVARLVAGFRRADRGRRAGSAATGETARAAGGGDQASPVQPSGPGHDPALAMAPRPAARPSPRARARQARRSRLRSQRP